jgi:hypothetical protein
MYINYIPEIIPTDIVISEVVILFSYLFTFILLLILGVIKYVKRWKTQEERYVYRE